MAHIEDLRQSVEPMLHGESELRVIKWALRTLSSRVTAALGVDRVKFYTFSQQEGVIKLTPGQEEGVITLQGYDCSEEKADLLFNIMLPVDPTIIDEKFANGYDRVTAEQLNQIGDLFSLRAQSIGYGAKVMPTEMYLKFFDGQNINQEDNKI